MAVETLRPNAAGDTTNLNTQFPAADEHYEKVDEVTADDFTTYVAQMVEEEEERTAKDLYNFLNSGIGAGVITNVRVQARFYGDIPE